MTKFEPIDARTLSITPLPPVRWLVPDLLSGGLSMLSGGSKIGKSWLCLWLCLQLAKGTNFGGGRSAPRRCCTSASRIHTPASRTGCSG